MTFGATQTSAGKIYTYFDLSWSFIVSMLIFEVGSLICGVAPSSTTLIVGRAVAGVGGAGLSVGGTCIVSLAVPPVKRPLIMGIIGMTFALAAVLGPLLGGVLTDRATWRWCFWINLPIGGAAAVAVFLFLKVPEGSAAPLQISWKKKLLHLDPVGVALAMGATTSFILALQYAGNTHPWSSSMVIGLLVGFGLLVMALVGWEIWLGEFAMMTPRLYAQRSLSSTAAVFALLGGLVVMKTGRPQQVMFVGSMLATVAIGLIYTLDIGSSTGKWIGYQILVGAAMAFAIMHGVIIAQANAAPEDLSAVTANLLFFQTIGGAFSNAAGTSAFVNTMLATLPRKVPGVDPGLVLLTGASELRNVFQEDVLPGILESYMQGIKGAFAVAVAFAGLAFLCSLAVPTKKLPTHARGENPMVIG